MKCTLIFYHIFGLLALLWCMIVLSQFAVYISTQNTKTTLTVVIPAPNYTENPEFQHLESEIRDQAIAKQISHGKSGYISLKFCGCGWAIIG